MKDSWFKVILYVIFVTFLIVIPNFIKTAIDPSMDYQMYEEMKDVIAKDFRYEQASIVDGKLIYESYQVVDVDYFKIYLGNHNLNPNAISFVFEEQSIAVYAMDIELDRVSYQSLNLETYDFGSTEQSEITRLSVALKTVYERQTMLLYAEIIALYLFSLVDYLVIALLMAVLMAMFVQRVPMAFSMRLKLSLYLTTVYAVVQLVLVLFNASYLNVLGMIAAYIYHNLAYRSITIIPKGVI
jgi:hypothetical protein